jgi:hypothetical protein
MGQSLRNRISVPCRLRASSAAMAPRIAGRLTTFVNERLIVARAVARGGTLYRTGGRA